MGLSLALPFALPLALYRPLPLGTIVPWSSSNSCASPVDHPVLGGSLDCLLVVLRLLLLGGVVRPAITGARAPCGGVIPVCPRG